MKAKDSVNNKVQPSAAEVEKKNKIIGIVNEIANDANDQDESKFKDISRLPTIIQKKQEVFVDDHAGSSDRAEIAATNLASSPQPEVVKQKTVSEKPVKPLNQ